jgi:DNA-binding CsgD family transcriptional regulator
MIQHIRPISKDVYKKAVASYFSNNKIDDAEVLHHAQPIIAELPRLMNGNFFWRVYTRNNYCLKAGGAVKKLTPYTADVLMQSKAADELMIALFHPAERELVFSFVEQLSAYYYQLPLQRRNQQSANLYYRLRQYNGIYKWVNTQYPYCAYDADGKEMGGLIVYTDISHLHINLSEPVMTVVDAASGDMIHYCGHAPAIDAAKTLQAKIPGLSRRQAQVLHLITQGKTSKAIATLLGIAPNTVENHRHTLLKKFGASSSLDLLRQLKDEIQ